MRALLCGSLRARQRFFVRNTLLQNSGIGNNDGDHADDDDEDEDEEDEDDQHTPERHGKKNNNESGQQRPGISNNNSELALLALLFPLTGAKLPATKKERRELFNIYNSLL